MNNTLEKTKEVFGLIVMGAEMICALSALWAEIAPKVKTVLEPFVENCKKLADEAKKDEKQTQIMVIEAEKAN